MKQFSLLCAHTARSSAYLQALLKANLIPEKIIFYGQITKPISSNRDLRVRALGSVYCPNLTLNGFDIAKEFNCPVVSVSETSLKSSSLIKEIQDSNSEVWVYSGYGGQIVPNELLNLTQVLHIHSGWLPQYRGSTTLYHEVIEHQACAASAIYLRQEIDTGPILARKKYPLPPANMDVDYLYDNAIRADLLVETLLHWQLSPNEIVPVEQTTTYPAYYIIHPLLKHLALQRIDEQEP